MSALNQPWPAVGDLVLLPTSIVPQRLWFRVLGVRSPAGDVSGWCYLDGYLIHDDGRQEHGTHFVPVGGLVIDRTDA